MRYLVDCAVNEGIVEESDREKWFQRYAGDEGDESATDDEDWPETDKMNRVTMIFGPTCGP